MLWINLIKYEKLECLFRQFCDVKVSKNSLFLAFGTWLHRLNVVLALSLISLTLNNRLPDLSPLLPKFYYQQITASAFSSKIRNYSQTVMIKMVTKSFSGHPALSAKNGKVMSFGTGNIRSYLGKKISSSSSFCRQRGDKRVEFENLEKFVQESRTCLTLVPRVRQMNIDSVQLWFN